MPSVWMDANFTNYSHGLAPVIAMPKRPNHNLTLQPQRHLERDFRDEMNWTYPHFEWDKIPENDIIEVSA